jgi:hypothetical protein
MCFRPGIDRRGEVLRQLHGADGVAAGANRVVFPAVIGSV